MNVIYDICVYKYVYIHTQFFKENNKNVRKNLTTNSKCLFEQALVFLLFNLFIFG